MTAHESVFKGAKIEGCRTVPEITAALSATIPANLTAADVIFLCIGIDRLTGDSLGPFVGTYLSGLGYEVCGTIDDPTHAMNLAERIEALPPGKTVIAVDAMLGRVSSVGTVSVISGPLKPGAGVGKELPEAGDYAITGCVNVGSDDNALSYRTIGCTRLSVVMRLARDITSAIVNVLPADGKRREPVIEAPAKRKRGRPRKNPTKTAEGVNA